MPITLTDNTQKGNTDTANKYAKKQMKKFVSKYNHILQQLMPEICKYLYIDKNIMIMY
jgi:hypothetical protein